MPLDVADLNWLVGFFEAEGTFGINIGIRNNGISVSPQFRVSISIHDKETLTYIHSKLGFGRLNKRPKSYWIKYSPNAQDQLVYSVDGIKNALRFMETFSPDTLRTVKKQTYILWMEAVKLIYDYAHLERDGLLRLCKIRDLMNTTRIRKCNYRDAKWFEQYCSSHPALFTQSHLIIKQMCSARKRRTFK